MRPHRCPVCDGKGQVNEGFYNAIEVHPVAIRLDLQLETCRTCVGSGIVWERDEPPRPEHESDTMWWCFGELAETEDQP